MEDKKSIDDYFDETIAVFKNRPKVDLEDPDLMVNLVNRRQTDNRLNETYEKSMKPEMAPYQPFEKKVKKDLKKKIIIGVCTLLVVAGISKPVIQTIDNNNRIYGEVSTIASPIKASKEYGELAANGHEHYWWYDFAKMEEGLNELDQYSIDAKIYSAYATLQHEWGHEDTLDSIVYRLTGLDSFDTYLQTKGFNKDSIKDWEKLVREELLAYSKLTDAQAKLNEEPSTGGR